MNRPAQFRIIFELMSRDARLSALHVALYHSMLRCWRNAKGAVEFKIKDATLREASKIHSIRAYQRCLKELEEWGYLRYFPSQLPGLDSRISLTGIDTNSPRTKRWRSQSKKTVLPTVNKQADAWPEMDLNTPKQAILIKLAQLIAQVAIQLLIAHLNKYVDLL